MQFGQALALDLGGQRDVVGQREFDAAAFQPRFDFGEIAFDETHREVRIAFARDAQHERQVHRRDRAEHAYLHFAASGVAAVVGLEGGGGLEEPACFVELARAEARQRHFRPRAARKEILAEERFQFADRDRDGRLRHAEFVRSSGRAARLRGGDEVAKQAQRDGHQEIL